MHHSANGMKRRQHLFQLGLLGAALFKHASAVASGGQSPDSKPTAHPRLLVGAAQWDTLAERRRADPDLDLFATRLLARARKDLDLDVLARQLIGRRLLDVSRECIRRVLQWAFAHRVTGEAVFLNRARSEMLAVASFSDWNPSHFLDVAEMTTGLAIGYDWLFHALSAQDRATVRRAIVDKGIAQARGGHKTFRYNNNWNQVCIGGMVLGALAVQEDEPALARDLLAAAQRDLFSGLAAYAPDGVYPEGPGYWSYGTSYSVLLVAALRTTAVPDWGVLNAPGFARSAEFYAHSIGPSGKHFNFADGGEGQELPSAIVFLARELNQPALLSAKRAMVQKNQGLHERFAPLSVLWWPVAQRAQAPVLAFAGQGDQPLAIWRSSWTDPDALWFAIKGGGAAHNHAHMDAGSFVLDQAGLRWAKDLGLQSYESLESRGVQLWDMKQDSPRWRVFRLSSEAHNTLTLGGQPHNAHAMAGLRMVNEHEAVIDLAPVLGLKLAQRRARFSNSAVVIEDRIEGAKAGAQVRWAMCTEADIVLKDNTATLVQKGKSLSVTFTGQGVVLSVLDIGQPRNGFDQPNPNTRQLIATAPIQPDGRWRMVVVMGGD
jgi:oligo-alginate lyase